MFPFSSPQRILDQEREWHEAQARPTPLEDEIKRERNNAWTEEDYQRWKASQPCPVCQHKPCQCEIGGEG